MKSSFVGELAHICRKHATATAVVSGAQMLTYSELYEQVQIASNQLETIGTQVVGIVLDNGVPWIVYHLAAMQSGIVFVPIPSFFSRAQKAHVIKISGIDTLIVDLEMDLAQIDSDFKNISFLVNKMLNQKTTVSRTDLTFFYRPVQPCLGMPKGTAILTFTSGTTAAPKGVCISLEAIGSVINALEQSVVFDMLNLHLCSLPLAILLENIAGLLLPLKLGKTVLAPSLSTLGLNGSSQLDQAKFIQAINTLKPNSMILTPETLQLLVHAFETRSLTFKPNYLTVGGGVVAPALLSEAKRYGLDVYQGYGLSECASVVTLNQPGDNLLGSVGKVLPGCQIRIESDGEIMVKGRHSLGYLSENFIPLVLKRIDQDLWFPTGDIGELDKQGFLYVHGRKKSQLITSFGRNVSPEWLEAQLTQLPAIYQVCVVGDGQPRLSAIVVLEKQADENMLAEQIHALNFTLPDYARIVQWTICKQGFSYANGLATPTGRFKRQAIIDAFDTQITSLYQANTCMQPLAQKA